MQDTDNTSNRNRATVAHRQRNGNARAQTRKRATSRAKQKEQSVSSSSASTCSDDDDNDDVDDSEDDDDDDDADNQDNDDDDDDDSDDQSNTDSSPSPRNADNTNSRNHSAVADRPQNSNSRKITKKRASKPKRKSISSPSESSDDEAESNTNQRSRTHTKYSLRPNPTRTKRLFGDEETAQPRTQRNRRAASRSTAKQTRKPVCSSSESSDDDIDSEATELSQTLASTQPPSHQQRGQIQKKAASQEQSESSSAESSDDDIQSDITQLSPILSCTPSPPTKNANGSKTAFSSSESTDDEAPSNTNQRNNDVLSSHSESNRQANQYRDEAVVPHQHMEQSVSDQDAECNDEPFSDAQPQRSPSAANIDRNTCSNGVALMQDTNVQNTHNMLPDLEHSVPALSPSHQEERREYFKHFRSDGFSVSADGKSIRNTAGFTLAEHTIFMKEKIASMPADPLCATWTFKIDRYNAKQAGLMVLGFASNIDEKPVTGSFLDVYNDRVDDEERDDEFYYAVLSNGTFIADGMETYHVHDGFAEGDQVTLKLDLSRPHKKKMSVSINETEFELTQYMEAGIDVLYRVLVCIEQKNAAISLLDFNVANMADEQDLYD